MAGPPPVTRDSVSLSDVDSKPSAPVRAGTVLPFLLNVTAVFPSQKEVPDSPFLAGLAEGLRGGEGLGVGAWGRGTRLLQVESSEPPAPQRAPARAGRSHTNIAGCPCSRLHLSVFSEHLPHAKEWRRQS